MKASTTGAVAHSPAPASPDGGERRTGLPRVVAVLGAGLAIAVLYAAFANGASGLPEEARLEVGLAALAALALAALLFNPGLGLAASPAALAGLVLLAGFALWCGLSFQWTIAPDLTWTDLNRAVLYALFAALALAVASNLPRRIERTALAYLALALAVALYALGGKALPGLNVPGVFDLNHTDVFSRLRAPFGYWNALALFCVLGVPVALALAADRERSPRARLAGLLATLPLLTAIALTYSRGGIAVLVVAVFVLIALGPDRLRLLVAAGIGLVAAAPAIVVGFAREDLTTDALAVAERSDDGLLFLAALVLGAANALVLGVLMIRSDERLELGERARRALPLAALVAVTGVLAISAGILAASDRGLGGTVSHQWDEFRAIKFDPQNDPARLVKTSSGNRWAWWREAAGAWSDRPLTGHGAGSFPSLHLLHRENPLEVKQAHSVPLELLAESGLIGAALALGGIGLLVFAGIRGLRAAPRREARYAGVLLAGLAAWGVHMWVDWDFEIPGATLPVLLFAGVLAARPAAEAAARRGPRAHGFRRAAGLAAGTALLCAAAISALMPSLAKDRASEALAAANAGRAAEGVEQARIAQRLNPFAIEPLFAEGTIARRRRDYESFTRLLEKAADRQPRNPRVWSRIAIYRLSLGDLEGAFRAGAVLVSLDPRGDFVRELTRAPRLAAVYSATAAGTPLPEAAPPAPAPVPQPQPPVTTPGTNPTTPGAAPQGSPAP